MYTKIAFKMYEYIYKIVPKPLKVIMVVLFPLLFISLFQAVIIETNKIMGKD